MSEITLKDIEAYCKARCMSIVTDDMMRVLKDAYDAEKVKTGHWIIGVDEMNHIYGECSTCGKRQYAGNTPYCPYCGSHNQKEV